MKKYENMSKAELLESLREQQELLDEVTEERMFVLGQQNIHLSGAVVKRYQNELDEIKENIARLESLIQTKK